MSQQPESYEQGWPARDFDEAARDYLLDEARPRVQEQIAHIGAQDVKTVALFTASAIVFTATGLIGDVRFALTPVAILTLATIAASLGSWFFLGTAYWTRDVKVGIDLEIIQTSYAGASERTLRDASLEALAYAFKFNQQVVADKATWIRRSFIAVAVQFLLLVASVLANSAVG